MGKSPAGIYPLRSALGDSRIPNHVLGQAWRGQCPSGCRREQEAANIHPRTASSQVNWRLLKSSSSPEILSHGNELNPNFRL